MTDENETKPAPKPCPYAFQGLTCGSCDTCIGNMPSTLLLKNGGPIPTKSELYQELRNRSLGDPILYHVMSLCRHFGLDEEHMVYIMACAESEQFRQLKKKMLNDLMLGSPLQTMRIDT